MANLLTEAAVQSIADLDTHAEEISRLARAAKAMVDTAADWSYPAIDDAVAFLGRGYKKADIKAIASEMGIPVLPSHTKATVLADIKRRIAGHKESMERCSF